MALLNFCSAPDHLCLPLMKYKTTPPPGVNREESIGSGEYPSVMAAAIVVGSIDYLFDEDLFTYPQ